MWLNVEIVTRYENVLSEFSNDNHDFVNSVFCAFFQLIHKAILDVTIVHNLKIKPEWLCALKKERKNKKKYCEINQQSAYSEKRSMGIKINQRNKKIIPYSPEWDNTSKQKQKMRKKNNVPANRVIRQKSSGTSPIHCFVCV